MSDAIRLQELEDQEAIRQIFTNYATCLDGGDYAGYGALFSRKGVFGEAVGPAAITAQMEQYGARVDGARAEGSFHDAIHVISNHDIKVTGDTATAEVIWSYVSIDPDKVPTIYQMGRYNDDFLREDGVWKIAHHRISRIMGRGQLEGAAPARLDAAQARLQELEDREEIRQIFVDYARYLDGGDNAGYASLFAREGRMKASLGEAVGPAEIETLLNRYSAAKAEGAFPPAIHIMNNHDISISGDTATTDVVWFYLTSDPDNVPTVLQSGCYSDDLVREDGAWKIARHDISRVMGRGPMDQPQQTRLDRIEQRLKDVEDREAITRLCIETSNCLDNRDMVGYGKAFTEDGHWAGVVGRAVGPAAITALLSKFCQPWESEGHRTHHTTLDVIIDLDGDTAIVKCKWQHITRSDKDEPILLHQGHYDDRVRRTPDGWRFTRRAAYADIPFIKPVYQLEGA